MLKKIYILLFLGIFVPIYSCHDRSDICSDCSYEIDSGIANIQIDRVRSSSGSHKLCSDCLYEVDSRTTDVLTERVGSASGGDRLCSDCICDLESSDTDVQVDRVRSSNGCQRVYLDCTCEVDSRAPGVHQIVDENTSPGETEEKILIADFSGEKLSQLNWKIAIRSLPACVTHLLLQRSNYQGELSECFRYFTHLREVNLERCLLSSEVWRGVIDALGNARVEDLNLCKSNYKGEGIFHIHRYKSLEKLNLRGIQMISDHWSCMISLLSYTNLETLNLSDTNFQGEEIMSLIDCEKLVNINFAHCYLSSEKWKSFLRRSRNRISIVKPYFNTECACTIS